MSKEKKGTLIRDAVILFVITVVAAVALGFVNEITKDRIAQAKADAKTAAYKSVFPGLSETEELPGQAEAIKAAEAIAASNPQLEATVVNEIYVVKDSAGKAAGYVMSVTNSKAYGGKLTIAMGISADGTLQGIEFLTINETPGLGMRAKEESFKNQFNSVKTGSFGLSKAGISGDTEVDAISSATFTTKAVTRAVNLGLELGRQLLAENAGGVGR